MFGRHVRPEKGTTNAYGRHPPGSEITKEGKPGVIIHLAAAVFRLEESCGIKPGAATKEVSRAATEKRSGSKVSRSAGVDVDVHHVDDLVRTLDEQTSTAMLVV